MLFLYFGKIKIHYAKFAFKTQKRQNLILFYELYSNVNTFILKEH